MAIDEFITQRQASWIRLNELANTKLTSAEEVDEFVALYRSTSSDLSYARAEFSNPDLNAFLTQRIATASSVLYRKTESPQRAVRRYFEVTFPAAVWYLRRFILIAALAFILPALAVGIWAAQSPEVMDTIASESDRIKYVENRFEQYYRGGQSGGFAFTVTFNNIRVAFLAWGLGITAGIGTLNVLIYNGLMLGQVWAMFIAEGDQVRFWTLIAPHGLVELTAIWVAGGAGLAMGWALISPGERTRGQAFGEAARRSVTIVVGLMMVFLAAGMIEGFVTGRPWPAGLRAGIGLATLATFCAYWWLLGSRAVANGATGLWSEGAPEAESTVVRL